jgi:hypothetical protein
MIMKPGLRKAALTAHVTFSLGWFGAVAAFLALALVGMGSTDRDLVRASYLVMGGTTWFVIVPLAFASLITGVVSSLGTRWGLFRYYWIVIKLLITLVATVVLMIHTQTIDLLVSAAAKSAVLGAQLSGAQLNMAVASGLTLVVLLVITALSYYKPRGMTRYGWRKQQEERKQDIAIDAGTGQEQKDHGVDTVAFN